MYFIKKTFTISAAHQLTLPYESKCRSLHGHNWTVTVYCKAKELNNDGMVVDFSHIKHAVQDRLDHRFLNDVLPSNPTAENLARWICDQIEQCYRVDVTENDESLAIYEKDDC